VRGEAGGVTLDVEVQDRRRYVVRADSGPSELTLRIERVPDEDARSDAEPFVVEGSPAELVEAVVSPIRDDLRALAKGVVFEGAEIRDGRATVRAAPYSNDPHTVQLTLRVAARLAAAARAASAAGAYRDRAPAKVLDVPDRRGKLAARGRDVRRSFIRGLSAGRAFLFLMFAMPLSAFAALSCEHTHFGRRIDGTVAYSIVVPGGEDDSYEVSVRASTGTETFRTNTGCQSACSAGMSFHKDAWSNDLVCDRRKCAGGAPSLVVTVLLWIAVCVVVPFGVMAI
jgi:hypothetical protein